MTERNDVDRISLFRVQNEAGIAVRLRRRSSYAGHHPAEVVQLIRHKEISAEAIHLIKYNALVSSEPLH